MKFKFDNNLPIHQQLVEQISFYIVSGFFGIGDKLPSVRELASIAEVNHNTIQKALIEVEQLGLINTYRTMGKFVTEDINIIKEVKDKLIEGKLNIFLNDLKEIGIYSYELKIKKEKDEEENIYEYSKDK